MPKGLIRIYGQGLHLITSSCYHRLPFLNSAPRRDLFLKMLEETRKKYQFVIDDSGQGLVYVFPNLRAQKGAFDGSWTPSDFELMK